MIKVLLLVALLAPALVNRRRVLPRLAAVARGGGAPGPSGRLLRRALRSEVALIVVVLGVTSALVGYAPPVSRAGGPFSADRVLGAARLEVTVDPARAGANALHLYLFDRSSGAPFAGTKQITVQALLPSRRIGPLPVTMRKAGPGHFIAGGLVLSPAGTWELRVTDRVSDFDEDTTALQVPVR